MVKGIEKLLVEVKLDFLRVYFLVVLEKVVCVVCEDFFWFDGLDCVSVILFDWCVLVEV